MLDQARLAEQFGALLERQRQAESTYANMLASVKDAELRAQFEQLLRESQRHIELTERLIEIVE